LARKVTEKTPIKLIISLINANKKFYANTYYESNKNFNLNNKKKSRKEIYIFMATIYDVFWQSNAKHLKNKNNNANYKQITII